MVSLLNECREVESSDPAKRIDETWSGRDILPTSRCVALDTDGKPGADVKVIVLLVAVGSYVLGRIIGVKPLDVRTGDVGEFRREHRREAIRRALDLV